MRLDHSLALRAGGLGALAGVLAAVEQFLPALLGVPSPGQAGLPMFAVGAAGLVVSPVLVLAVGYRAGTRRNVAREYDTVALSFAVGGVLGYLAGYAGGVLAFQPGGAAEFAVLIAASGAYSAAVMGGWFAIAGVAGAAVGQFRGGDASGARTGPA